MDLDLFDHFTEPTLQKDADENNRTSGTSNLAKRAAEIDNALLQSKRSRSNNEHSETVTFSEVPTSTTAATETRGPAKVYPFKLDSFQQEAVNYIEREESVLVAAHTSAGKTAVAEYAIAKSLKNGQRVIYTSPIKALSNQKFRDLQEEFGNVGLMTGDMTINPHATCLIMTTEILRSMLYRGSEVMREVAWVIYDEVHYMRDKERGVVWEESIILLPHKVRFVFLSATIPNAPSFVSWVSKIHHQPCHVVYTDYRPVPLQHFLFPACAEGLYLAVDEKGKFRDDNFQRAMSFLQGPTAVTEGAALVSEDGGSGKKKQKKNAPQNILNDLLKIVKLIMERALDPCIVFSFSKKDCESYAKQMSRLEFNSDEEKALVEQVFVNAMDVLSEDDKQLPQIVTILPLLKRGIGIHHGGLLPILKEVIEILFQEGLIKCLFATETFSIGINMPAKTVVFTQTRKFDGKDFRWITSGEYIQMSGRAGRRGKDDRGIVIQMLDEKMEPDVAKNMIYGASDPLFSSYHVSYNMVLNMMRVEDANPENLIRCSFHQYQQEQNAPELEHQAQEIRNEAAAIEVPDEKIVESYDNCLNVLNETKRLIIDIAMRPEYCLPFLQKGRLIFVYSDSVDWGWGVVLNVSKNDDKKSSIVNQNFIANGSTGNKDYIIDVLMKVEHLENESDEGVAIAPINNKNRNSTYEMMVVHIYLSSIKEISSVRLNTPNDISKKGAISGIEKALSEIIRRFESPEGEGVPLLDYVLDLGVPKDAIGTLQERYEKLKNQEKNSPFHKLPDNDTCLENFQTKKHLLEEASQRLRKARESQAVLMKEQLRNMKRVLRRLEFVSAEGVLLPKGRFACELSTSDELVITNMVFDGAFTELSVDQIVALLSCFVFKEASSSSSGGAAHIRSDMQNPFRQLQAVARHAAQVCSEMQLTMDEDEYVDSFNPGLVDVSYEWSAGAKFSEICRLSDAFEGSIIRSLRRLEELLRQLAAAASAIGNAELKNMFEEGARRIRRGVVFAASLYI